MRDREFFEVLRQRALDLTENARRSLTMHPKAEAGETMAPHVAKERVMNLRKLARQFDALANVAEHL